MNKTLNVIKVLKRAKFDKSRLRVYYGNIGEIITQQVLRKQGFEVWLTRPISYETDFLHLFRIPKIDEEIEELHRYYNSSSIRRSEGTWKDYLDRHKDHIKREIERLKANRAFFGEQLDAFIEYLNKLKIVRHRSESQFIPRKYIPDLVAKRNGKIYVIEVKSRKSAVKFLKDEKLEGFLLARKYGFIPALITFNLEIEAKDFKMKELTE